MADLRRPFLFVLLCCIWGSSWLVIKEGYGGLGPFNVAALRFLLAAALLFPVVFLLRARHPRGRTEWGLALFVGGFLFAGNYGLIYWGEQFLDSGLTAILFSTMPLLTLMMAHLYIPAERMTVRKTAGTLLAFAGIVALFGDRVRLDPGLAWPMLAVVGAAGCAGAASVAGKRHGRDLHPASMNAWAMLFGGALLTTASFVAGDGMALPRDTVTWAAVLYLATAGSIVTFLVYFYLMKTWSATTLSFISVFTSVIALALGFLVRDERPTLLMGLGALLVLGGVVLALRTPKQKGDVRAP